MALSQTSSSQMICDLTVQRRGILGSQIAMNAVDGATIERRIRINRPDDENTRCKVSRAWDPRKDFSHTHAATYNTFNVQRHLTSARTHRAFRASAVQTWREVVAAAGSQLWNPTNLLSNFNN